jgi:hypothetical protein
MRSFFRMKSAPKRLGRGEADTRLKKLSVFNVQPPLYATPSFGPQPYFLPLARKRV